MKSSTIYLQNWKEWKLPYIFLYQPYRKIKRQGDRKLHNSHNSVSHLRKCRQGLLYGLGNTPQYTTWLTAWTLQYTTLTDCMDITIHHMNDCMDTTIHHITDCMDYPIRHINDCMDTTRCHNTPHYWLHGQTNTPHKWLHGHHNMPQYITLLTAWTTQYTT